MIDEECQAALHTLKRNGLLRGVDISNEDLGFSNWVNPRHVAQLLGPRKTEHGWRVTLYYSIGDKNGQVEEGYIYKTEAEAQSVIDQIRAAW